MNKITLELLKEICPSTKSTILTKYVEPLNVFGQYFDLFENPKRIAAFLSQVAHESGGFNVIKENLNYSAIGLTKTFKKYFPTLAIATPYAKNPELIANKVYANRMGNGSVSSGDGYKFRGRGLIQLTGKQNYIKFAASINKSITDTIVYLETPTGAVASAGWFWNINKLNIYADKEDFIGLTRRINGGTIGLIDRKHHYELALRALT